MKTITKAIFFIAAILLVACSKSETETVTTANASIDVFKTPTCGCCGLWVDHLEENGLNTSVHDKDSLTELKDELGIPGDMRSCHTGVSSSGFFFEGHIPAKYVSKFLANPPEGAAGLAVPGMPLGSPGMEMDKRFNAYNIMQVNKDGSLEVYAKVDSFDAQHN